MLDPSDTRAGTVSNPMARRRTAAPPAPVHPAYLAELRRRVEAGPGVLAVAERAGISRTTVWRTIAGAVPSCARSWAPTGI